MGRPGRLIRAGRRSLRRRGLLGTAQAAVSRVRQRAWVDESHVWYELPVEGGPTADDASLPSKTRLFEADERHLPLLERLPTPVTAREAKRRLRGGAELWLAMRGDEPLFGAWLFKDDAPVAAAPHGHLELPDELVIVEDVATADSHRGRGIAPGVLSALAARLDRRRTRAVLAKVEHQNRPSRRAFRKAGFRPIARMHRQERGPFTAVQVEPERRESRSAHFLRDRLARRFRR